MALDTLWMQQLTLVSYGTDYLNDKCSIEQLKTHIIFNQTDLQFRDLNTQHLLAQHFQVWLEGLKQQGITRLSLHRSDLLLKEKNPNANVELIPTTHIMISHAKKEKLAWILGQELAEWYLKDESFDVPSLQQSPVQQFTFWQHRLPESLGKQIDSELNPPNWNEIAKYIQNELFDHPYAQDFHEPELQYTTFTGANIQTIINPNENALSTLTPPKDQADLADQLLWRLQALKQHIAWQINSPEHNATTAGASSALQQFAQHIDEIQGKLITKIANHHHDVKPIKAKTSPLDPVQIELEPDQKHALSPKNNNTSPPLSAVRIIIIILMICALAYYFGM